jgi:NADH-quinone oxidoreductase subunit I
MYGKGILKGLNVTWKRFWGTYIEDISWMMSGKKRYFTEEGIKHRASKHTKGIFTVQYPEEQLIQPEEFRFVPFLVYDEGGLCVQTTQQLVVQFQNRPSSTSTLTSV